MAADAAGKLAAFVEHVSFGAVANGESLGPLAGRHGRFVPAQVSHARRTERYCRQRSADRSVLISEVMYKPSVAAGQNPDDYEYVEIFNPTNAAVPLDNGIWPRA